MNANFDQPLVMVVDDEPHVTFMISKRFSKNGYQVQQAHDGLQALDLIKQFKPSIILTDYQMPNMDGLALAEKLFEHPDTQQIPLVVLTARGHKIPEEKLNKTNIKKIVAKPFTGAQALKIAADILKLPAPA